MNDHLTYREVGVDVKKAEILVKKIQGMAASTYGPQVLSGVGGFASLYEMGDRYLAAGTDGVGSKLKIAQALGIHHTIGIDLVAMCSNDTLCTGAKNLFFLDYLATGQLNLQVSEHIIEGIVEGCRQAGAALIGGETAEMPDLYAPEEYDLAGFMVAEVKKGHLIDGRTALKGGETLIGLASTGLHSNGFSLARKLIKPEETELLGEALTPTRIYASLGEQLFKHHRPHIKGLAHITGGGLSNISRMNQHFDYQIDIDALPPLEELPYIIQTVAHRSGLPREELYNTFNMGVGMVLATGHPEDVAATLEELGEQFWIIGKVIPKLGTGRGRILW